MPYTHNRQGVFVFKEEKTDFPSLYHQHHLEYQEDFKFWLSLARQGGSPLLELGCGTGRLLLPLAEAGLKCFGIDNDQCMLDFLQNKIPDEVRDRIQTFYADFISFSLDIQFPLIILPCNTYSTLQGNFRVSLLGCVYKQLTTNGKFAVSIPNPDLLLSQEITQYSEIETIFPHPDTGNPVQVSYSIEKSVEAITFHWYYDQLLPDGKVQRSTVSTVHTSISSSHYLDEIRNSGFEIMETFGSFDRSVYSKDSPNLIIVAQKFL